MGNNGSMNTHHYIKSPPPWGLTVSYTAISKKIVIVNRDIGTERNFGYSHNE